MRDNRPNNVDDLKSIAGKIADLWGYALATVGVLAVCHGRIVKLYRTVSRAFRLSNAIHDHFGTDPALSIVESLRQHTRDGAVREVRLTLLEESLGAGIYVCDATTGACTNCNTALAELYGLDKAAFRDSGWLSAVVPDDRIPVYERWQESVRKKIPYELSYFVRNQRTDRKFRVITKAYPAVLADGTILCYVGTCEEVS